MTTVSASRAEAAVTAPGAGPVGVGGASGAAAPTILATSTSPPSSGQRRLVWDAPVRVVHWLLVLCFAGAWLTGERETWRLLHVSLGYTLGGLLAFRLVWGLVGTRHARFSRFVRGPAAVRAYLGSLLRGRPQHFTGHNPAGAVAILALIALGGLLVASGWATYEELTPFDLGELHELVAHAMLLVVGAHIVGVVVSSRLHRENLVRAMLTGRKADVPAGESIRRAWWPVALLVVAAVIGFWVSQWRAVPPVALEATAAAAQASPAAAAAPK